MDFGTFVRRTLRAQRGSRTLLPGRAGALPVSISAAGWELEERPSYDWNGLTRRTPEHLGLQVTMSGQGSLTYEGRTMPVPPGTLMVVPLPHDHRYWLPAGGSWEFIYLGLRGREAMRAGRQLIARCGPVFPLTTASPALALLIGTCRQVLASSIGSHYQGSALAWSVLMAFLDEFAHGAQPAVTPPAIERAVAQVRSHYAGDLSASALARGSGYSRSHFSRLFQQSQGASPGAFIANVRIQAAMRLLREGRSVGEAASACGFTDSTYFCRVFRRLLGVSPGAFGRGRLY